MKAYGTTGVFAPTILTATAKPIAGLGASAAAFRQPSAGKGKPLVPREKRYNRHSLAAFGKPSSLPCVAS